MDTNEAKAHNSGPFGERPVSDAKRNANKKNAESSTGPRTPEGKARSSMNAMKHGVYASSSVAVPRGLLAEDPNEVERFLAGIEASFPARNPVLAQIASQIALNLLRQCRLAHLEAELLAASGRESEDLIGLTPEQVRELKALDHGLLVLEWVANQRAKQVADVTAFTQRDLAEVDPETVGRFLHHALLDELLEHAPELVTAPKPTTPPDWDDRIQAILYACFDDDPEALLEWVFQYAVEAEALLARADLLREHAAEQATGYGMARTALLRTRLVHELRNLIDCYRTMEEITGAG